MKNQYLIADKIVAILLTNIGSDIRDKTEVFFNLPLELAKNGIRSTRVASDAISQAIETLKLERTHLHLLSELVTLFKKERTHHIALSLIKDQNIAYFNGGFQKYNKNSGSYYSIEEALVKKEIKLHAGLSLSSFEIKDISEHLRIESTVSQDNLNLHQRDNLINCKNNMVEIKEDEVIIHPHSPKYYSTGSIGVPYIKNSQCSLWLNFLSETFEHQGGEKDKAIQLLQEMMGYMLIPGNGYQKLFSFYGVSRSGKSLCGAIISKMLGEENVSGLPFEQLGKEGRTVELASKLLNLSGELSRNIKIDSAPIKSLVGQDKVFGRKIYSSPFYFVNPAKLLTISNSLPLFNDNSSAIYERLIILNFDTQVPPERRDSKLVQKLEKELEGIFLWAIQGLISLKKRGRFEELQRGIETKETIQLMSDSILYWLQDSAPEDINFEFRNENLGRISLKKFYDDYVAFCKHSSVEIERKSEFKLRISQFEDILVFRDTKKNQDYVEINL